MPDSDLFTYHRGDHSRPPAPHKPGPVVPLLSNYVHVSKARGKSVKEVINDSMPPSKVSSGYVMFEDEKVLFLRFKTHIVYLIGSNHTNPKYALLVQRVMKYVQPEVVGVELCRTRMGYKSHLAASQDKYEEFNFQAIPPSRRQAAIGEKLRLLYAYGAIQYEESEDFREALLSYRKLTSYTLPPEKVIQTNDRTTIGAELYVPFRHARWHSNYRLGPAYLNNFNMKYKILLLDRPVEDTYDDLSRALTNEEKACIRSYKRDFVKLFTDGRGRLMEDIWKRNEVFRKIFIDLRDAHMAHMIYQAIARHRFDKLVCIVGKTHMNGIVRYLIKKLDELDKM